VQLPHSHIAVYVPVLAVAFALAACQSPKAQSAGPPPPVPVSVAVATQEAVPVDLRAVGTVEASAVIQVKSQISGELVRVVFTEGGDVNQGDLLFEIDSRPYRETVRQAEAALARDTAQLRQAEANLARDTAQSKNADSDAARYAQLAKDGVVARSQDDQFRTTAEALRASIQADQAAIESSRASVESDRATVDKAKLDLGYCEIHSPVTGRAGNLLVHAGNLVTANGATPLVVINQLEPIWVSFGMPEDRLSAIRRNSAARKLDVTAALRDEPNKVLHGSLTVIDNTVDTATGTIRLKATFSNQGRLLWPGAFVNVSLTLDTQKAAIVVPAEAVQPGQKGQMIYVVKSDQTVEPRPVTVGPSHGDKVIIEKGLAAGETVVIDGQLRLFPGVHIQPVPAGKIDSQPL
jgi:multidrug efflux system membrane fusion protein